MANVLKKEEGILNCNPGDKNSRPGAPGVTSVGGRVSLLWRPWGGGDGGVVHMRNNTEAFKINACKFC